MKVLVLSNNCFARNNSNGRILGCLFDKLDKSDVAQFYIIEGTNDFDICANYYLVSDKMALQSLFTWKGIGKQISEENVISSVEKISEYRSKFGKTVFTSISRNFVWKRYCWWNNKFKQWLSNFSPEVVVLQCGDTPFMYDIAVKISKQLSIPLVLFNTEYDYFKTNSWFQDRKNNIVFKYFKHRLRSSISRAYSYSSLSIYNSDWLKEKYDKEFHRPGVVIYQSSDFRLPLTIKKHNNTRIRYIGGLVYGRGFALVDIANALKCLNPQWNIEVYGIVQDDKTKLAFDTTHNIHYMGGITYSEVIQVIAESDLLLHVENPEPKYATLTDYGFSTKITDYLFSGIPVFAYGSKNNVGLSYLRENNAAVVVSDKEQLHDRLKEVLFNSELRELLVQNALSLAEMNHSAEKNAIKFRNIVDDVIRNNDFKNVELK